MEDIVVVFSRPSKFYLDSWLIQKSQGTEFSHVCIKMMIDGFDTPVIVQASSLFVNIVPVARFIEENDIVDFIAVSVTPEQKQRLMAICIDTLGVPYGFKELVGLGIVWICRLFGSDIKNPFGDGEKSYICSELVAQLLSDGLLLTLPKSLDDMTPRDVHEMLRGKP